MQKLLMEKLIETALKISVIAIIAYVLAWGVLEMLGVV